MGFQLDTSGAVLGDVGRSPPVTVTCWGDLDPFTQGYVEAMFAGANPLYELAFSDLAPETLARIIEDCAHTKSPRTSEGGARFWQLRQEGYWFPSILPPLTVSIGDGGKVYTREAV